MSNPAKPKPQALTLAISAIILILLVALTVIFWQPLIELFSNSHHAREAITRSGPWGPVVFMLMQVAQVLVAPIPGQVTGFVGGFLFGPWLGTLYTTIGASIGFTLVFILSRRLGRPFVEYFVDPKILKKFDYIASERGALILFLIFLLPAFPDDLICYIAGLTSIKIRTLILVSLAGRMPGYILLSLSGSGAAESNAQLVTITAVIMAAIVVFAYWKRSQIENWIKGFSRPPQS